MNNDILINKKKSYQVQYYESELDTQKRDLLIEKIKSGFLIHNRTDLKLNRLIFDAGVVILSEIAEEANGIFNKRKFARFCDELGKDRVIAIAHETGVDQEIIDEIIAEVGEPEGRDNLHKKFEYIDEKIFHLTGQKLEDVYGNGGRSNRNRNGTSKRTSFYGTRRWMDTAQRIRERDKYTCQKCGAMMTGGMTTLFPVHHIKSLKSHPDLAFDPDNLITLCPSCHQAVEAETE